MNWPKTAIAIAITIVIAISLFIMFVSYENIVIVIDIIKSISIIFAAIATTVAAWVAFYGINTWKRELIGKKKHDLAEEVLTLFYQAEDAFISIRHLVVFPWESASRKVSKTETREEKEVLDQAYVVIERLKNHQEVFNRLKVLRYKFMALFGENNITPFDEFNTVLNEIIIANNQLVDMWQQQSQDSYSKKRFESVLHAIPGSEDEIAQKVNSAIKEIKEICVPILGNK